MSFFTFFLSIFTFFLSIFTFFVFFHFFCLFSLFFVFFHFFSARYPPGSARKIPGWSGEIRIRKFPELFIRIRPEISRMIRGNPDPEISGAFHPYPPGKFPDDPGKSGNFRSFSSGSARKFPGAFHPDPPGNFPDDPEISARIFRISESGWTGDPGTHACKRDTKLYNMVKFWTYAAIIKRSGDVEISLIVTIQIRNSATFSGLSLRSPKESSYKNYIHSTIYKIQMGSLK